MATEDDKDAVVAAAPALPEEEAEEGGEGEDEEEESSGLSRQESLIRETTKGRKHRASVTTRLITNLQRESQSMSSWVVGLLFLESDPGFELVRDTIGGRLLEIPRFRSRVKAKRFPARTEFVELGQDEFDEKYHFRQEFKGQTVSNDQLDEFVGNMFNDFNHPMDKPLWQITYVPKLEDGRACVITNISHAIGDGIAQIEVLMRMLDKPEGGNDGDEVPISRAPSAKSTASSTGQAKRRKPPALGPLTKTKVFLGGLWDGVGSVFGSPDPRNTLRLKKNTKPSATKRCCFSESIDLDRLKEIKNMYEGATLNDIMVTLLTLTLRAYFNEVDDRVALRSRVRAQFPVNIRSKSQGAFRGDNPRNKFSYGFMPFHVSHKGNQSSLLWRIKRTLDKLKSSPSPYVQERVGKIISQIMPLGALNAQLLNLADKATAQISNVPGPQGQVTVAGTRLDDMRFLLYSPLSFYCGLLTYNGSLSASFCIDSSLADPKLLAKHWLPEFEKFYAHAVAAPKDRAGLIRRPRGCLDCL